MEKLLKLDPSNAELLAQKHKLLSDAVSQTKERLKQLKEASEQAAKTKDNYAAWQAAITPIWKEIDETAKHLDKLKKKQEEMKDAGEINTDAYNALQLEIDETDKRLKSLKEQQKQVTDEFGRPISPEKYDALQREIIETENDLQKLENQSNDTGKAEKELADESQNAGKGLQSLGAAAKAVGAALAAAFAASTAAVTAFSASSVSVGSAFDKSMAQVAATMGKTTSEIADLRAFAMDMGAKTAFSASQAADALNYMALAGYSAETSMQALPSVLNLAAAGSMELASASDMITDSLSALGKDSDYAATLVDQMAAASSRANASVSQMGSAILTVGGTAKVLAGGTTELNTVLGLLADNGVKGSESGTALRNVILSLTAPTNKAAAALKDLGVKALDQSGNMRPLKDIFTDLNGAMSEMSEGKKTEVLNEIFNKVDLKSVNALLATNVTRWDELSAAIEHSKYAAEKMADTQLDNLAGDVELFKSALEGSQITFSEVLMPSAREFVQFATDGISKVTDAFKNANAAQTLAQSFRDADGAMKPIQENADAIRDKLSAFRELAPYFSFRDEAGQLGEVGDLADGLYQTLSQLTADQQQSLAEAWELDNADALYEILDPANELQWKLEKMIATADSAMQSDADILQALFPGQEMNDVLSWLDGSQEGLANLQAAINGVDASNINDGFSAAIAELPAIIENGVSMVMNTAPQFLEIGVQVLSAVAEGIRNNFPAVGDAASGALSFIVDGILNGLPVLTESAVSMMTSFGQSIRERLPDLMKSGLEIAVGLSASIRDNAGKLVDGAVSLALSLAKGLADSIPTIVENVPTIVTNIAGVINDNAPKILQAGVGIIVTLGKGLIQAIPTIVANIPKIIQAVVAVFTAFNWLNLGKNIMTALKNGIANMKTAITGTMKNISESAANFFKNAGDFQGLGKAVMNLLKSGIDALKDKVPQALHDIATSAKEKFTNIDWAQIGKDILTGLWNGIGSMKDWLLGKAGGLVSMLMDTFTGKKGFDEHSPSKWAQRVGEYVSIGLANGIEKEASKAEQAAEKMASNVYNGLSKWADKTTKYERLSLQEQLDMWNAILARFQKGTEQWDNAYDKVWDLEAKLASERAQEIKNTYNGLVQAVEYAVKRYGWSTRTQLSHYEEIRDQFEKNSEEWLAADEKVFDTRQKLLGEQQTAWKNYASDLKKVTDTVNTLESDYQKQLSKRAGEIANSYKLFSAVPEAVSVSGKDLLQNLQGQIKSIGAFYDNLDRLSKRGVSAALVDEIRSMGVGASDQLNALLALSDKKLSQYAALYQEKQDLANRIASDELDQLRNETNAKIRESLDSIESLYDQYAPAIGLSLPQGLAEGIRNGMKEALDAADELATALQLKFDAAGILHAAASADHNAQILALEPAPQNRAVRVETYDDSRQNANAPSRSAPVSFTVQNNVGGRRVQQLNYRYEQAEAARRGPALVQT